jgi:hypothetical protein
MANEPPRLSTADLRRRLLGAAVAPTPVPAPAGRAAEPRLAVPADVADQPIDEDAPTLNFEARDEDSILPIAQPIAMPVRPTPVPVRPTPVPVRPTPPPDTVRPANELLRPAHELLRERYEPLHPTGKGNSFFPSPHPTAPVAQPLPDVNPALLREPAPVDPALEALRIENDQLRQLMEEMRQLLQDASDQEARVQGELAERDRLLTEARHKADALENQVNSKPKTKDELEEWADELEQENAKISKEKRELDDDRRQLREDEEALEKQMRDMEVQMARERAMLARQEQELKRLNAEIQHELEVMQQGGGALRDRLAVFQRRHAEVVGGIRSGSNSNLNLPMAEAVTPAPPKKGENGLLRKIFRGE